MKQHLLASLLQRAWVIDTKTKPDISPALGC